MAEVIYRASMYGALLHAKGKGFLPKTVIDVGAGLGTFELYGAFPDAQHLLIEPIQENEIYLKKICQILDNAEYIIAAATKETEVVPLQVSTSNYIYSSITENREVNPACMELRQIQAITLDRLYKDRNLSGPFLIKIDVDGKELDVLYGAREILKNTEIVVMEIAIFNQFPLINFMKEAGFIIYDIVDIGYTPNQDLWQFDLFFVKEKGQLVITNYSENKQQEAEVNTYLSTYRKNMIDHIENLLLYKQQKLEVNDLYLKTYVVDPQLINYLQTCIDRYINNPSQESIIAELRQLRQKLANSWLKAHPYQLETIYQNHLIKTYQALMNSGFRSEPLTETEQPLFQELAHQLGKGFTQPQALNYLLAIMPYFPQGKMRIVDAQVHLPQWLLKEYQQFFETV